jgi:hypothetical protein
MEAIANLPSDKRIELIDFLDGEYTTEAVMNWLRKEGIALETGGYTGIFDGAKAA